MKDGGAPSSSTHAKRSYTHFSSFEQLSAQGGSDFEDHHDFILVDLKHKGCQIVDNSTKKLAEAPEEKMESQCNDIGKLIEEQ